MTFRPFFASAMNLTMPIFKPAMEDIHWFLFCYRLPHNRSKHINFTLFLCCWNSSCVCVCVLRCVLLSCICPALVARFFTLSSGSHLKLKKKSNNFSFSIYRNSEMILNRNLRLFISTHFKSSSRDAWEVNRENIVDYGLAP